MRHFKEFCDSIPKNKHGYVPDLLDLVAQGFGDLCMASFISDSCFSVTGQQYLEADDMDKNFYYSVYESDCQDAIDEYNQAIDDAKDDRKMSDDQFFDFMNPYVNYFRTNQAEIDAGFIGTGKEFC